jgi:hypothetical protein
VPVTIQSITDQWPGRAPFSPPCAATLDGTVLQPGDTATCTFSVTGYAPPPGTARTDLALVTVCQASTPSNCTTGSASSTVSTPPGPALSGAAGSTPTSAGSPSPAPALSASSGQGPSALAFTGAPADLWLLVELGLSLASVGFFLLWATRPRRPAVVQR